MLPSRKVVVVGLDSITPVMVERFLAEGRMPNLQKLRERGWSSEITPTMPPTTPAGWTTIATGAWPSTHGIEGFAVHVEGEALDKKTHALSTGMVKAELLWQAVERAGKRSILLKYPVSWPPVGGDRVVQVDGAGGWGGLKCVWDLAHSTCWDTAAPSAPLSAAPEAQNEDWLTRDQDNLDEENVQRLRVQDPGTWINLPLGSEPSWETCLEVGQRGTTPGATIFALALRVAGEDRVIIASTRDGTDAPPLTRGEWTGHLPITLPTAQGHPTGHVRFKVMDFDAAGRRLRLYQTQAHQSEGYTRPAALARELHTVAGPFVEWTESYDLLQGWIDDATQIEIYEQHVAWMSRAARHLLRTQDWDLFMTQVHFVDMAYHMYWGAIAPEHPQYDPARAPFYWELLGHVHALADQFLGAVLEEVPEDVLVVVLGDHGHDLYHTAFLANHLLLREGLLAVRRDPRTGAPRIDWNHTSAFASSYRVFLNVSGRDPHGIVPEREYRTRQEQVIRALQGARDPRTGDHPVRLAVRREDAEAIGLYGSSMGDVVFAMAPGYQTRGTIQPPSAAWIGQRLLVERIPVFKPTTLFREFTGEHDTALPFTRAIRTMLTLAGPGVRSGQGRVPVSLVDITPTICRFLNVPFPAQCEGSPLWRAFYMPKECVP